MMLMHMYDICMYALRAPTLLLRVCQCQVACAPAGAYDKGVSCLRSYHKEDMCKVAQDIFSHLYVKAKNAVVIKLIVSVGVSMWG